MQAGTKQAGVDILDVSRGNFSSSGIIYEVPPIDLPRGFNVDNAVQNQEGYWHDYCSCRPN